MTTVDFEPQDRELICGQNPSDDQIAAALVAALDQVAAVKAWRKA